jgi:hypothetical protein
VLGKDLTPVVYRFLGHSGIESRSPSDVTVDDQHVRVYSEPGGHASHGLCNPNETVKVAGFDYHLWLNDLNQTANVIRQETWTGGSVSWPADNSRSHTGGSKTPSGGLINIGEKRTSGNGQVFVQYSGLWGSLGSNFSGFWGPAYNETQMGSDGLITAWCYGMKASRANVALLHAECYPADVSE